MGRHGETSFHMGDEEHAFPQPRRRLDFPLLRQPPATLGTNPSMTSPPMSSAVVVGGSQSPWIHPRGGAARELDAFFAFFARSNFAVLSFVIAAERSDAGVDLR